MVLELRGTVVYFLKKFQPLGKWLLIRVAYTLGRIKIGALGFSVFGLPT